VLGFYPEWGLSQAATSPVSHLQAGREQSPVGSMTAQYWLAGTKL
jgi:hypothetical protein